MATLVAALDLVGGPDSTAVTVTATEAVGVLRPTGFASDFELVRLAENGANAGHYWADFTVGADANNRTQLSFYVLPDERTYISAQVGPAYAQIDLTDGTVADEDADPLSGGLTWFVEPTVTDAGNGWWFVTMTLQYPAPDPAIIGLAIQLSDGVGWPGVGSYQGTEGYGLYLLSVPQVTGLDHLEGEEVSVVADGIVLASPYNADYDTITVTDGAISLPAGEYTTVSVGLPFVSDIQTLDLDTPGNTVRPGKFLFTAVGAYVEETMAFLASSEEPTTSTGTVLPAGGAMQAFQVLDRNETAVTTPQTGYRMLNFEGRWSQSGSVFIRNVDPTPLTVLALVPYGTFPR